MTMTCLVDLDGVLVDFVRGSFVFHQKSIPIKDVRWDFPKQIGFEGTWTKDFWDPLGYDFWVNLEWTSEGKQLLTGLEELFGDDIAIISSPCQTRGCRDGKGDWVEKHIPHYRKKVFLGSEKYRFAAPNKILFDDHEDNVKHFSNPDPKYNGKAILIPRPWNSRIYETDEQGCFCVETILKEAAAYLGK